MLIGVPKRLEYTYFQVKLADTEESLLHSILYRIHTAWYEAGEKTSSLLRLPEQGEYRRRFIHLLSIEGMKGE